MNEIKIIYSKIRTPFSDSNILDYKQNLNVKQWVIDKIIIKK